MSAQQSAPWCSACLGHEHDLRRFPCEDPMSCGSPRAHAHRGRRAAIIECLREWTGYHEPSLLRPDEGEPGYEHDLSCVSHGESQDCCLDASHPLFDKLVDKLAQVTA